MVDTQRNLKNLSPSSEVSLKYTSTVSDLSVCNMHWTLFICYFVFILNLSKAKHIEHDETIQTKRRHYYLSRCTCTRMTNGTGLLGQLRLFRSIKTYNRNHKVQYFFVVNYKYKICLHKIKAAWHGIT